MTKQQVVVRSQKSVGSSATKFGGPDKYVAVVTVPEGVDFDASCTPLQADRLVRKGITVEYIGEGYSRHSGPRSALGRAIAKARAIVVSA